MGQIVTKDAVIEPAEDDAEQPNGSFHVLLSNESLDRDGEVLAAGEWKLPLPEHITFDTDHGMSVATTVGSGVPEQTDRGIEVRGTYTSLEQGQRVRTLVNEGHIRTTSVAFMTEKSPAKDGKRTVTRELLNGAFVAVPANREALVLASKDVKAGARNSAIDAGHLQTIHDSAVSMGAACPAKAAKAATPAPDADPGTLALAVAVALDSAVNACAGVDMATMPAEMQQCYAGVIAADTAIDLLLEALGVTDPDETGDTMTGQPPTPTVTARAVTLRAEESAIVAARAAAYQALLSTTH